MNGSNGKALRLTVLGLVLPFGVLPIAAGLWVTGRAAFGSLPVIGAVRPSLAAWHQLAAMPGLWHSVAVTLASGLMSTLLSLILAVCLASNLWHGRTLFSRTIIPIISAPHAAVAIGLAFLLAPSGWIARVFSPWATGWSVPPDLATVQDPYGLALTLGLTLKEMPFLVMMALAGLQRLPVGAYLAQARSMGYRPAQAWALVILPQLYPLIRLPVYSVLAFALSVVDMGTLLGPTQPPTLAVAIQRWLHAPDLALLLPGSAGALALAAISLLSIAAWRLGEMAIARFMVPLAARGRRGGMLPALHRLASGAAVALLATGTLALFGMLLWSVSWRWVFPDALPSDWSLRLWMHPSQGWGQAAAVSLGLGLATSAIALALAILWLEAEDRGHMGRARWAEGLIYLPLLIPQLSFLFGLQALFVQAGVEPGLLAVTWVQGLFVFPYVMIALSDPWRALDPRLPQAAAALGAGPWRRLVSVKLPCLLGPLLAAAAVGFAVSMAQYLPTLFMGAGRVVTLTTEAVTLSSGGDRRIAAVYGALTSAMPLLAYGLATALPAVLHRHRRGLRGQLT